MRLKDEVESGKFHTCLKDINAESMNLWIIADYRLCIFDADIFRLLTCYTAF